jgi:hypothetical protein
MMGLEEITSAGGSGTAATRYRETLFSRTEFRSGGRGPSTTQELPFVKFLLHLGGQCGEILCRRKEARGLRLVELGSL